MTPYLHSPDLPAKETARIRAKSARAVMRILVKYSGLVVLIFLITACQGQPIPVPTKPVPTKTNIVLIITDDQNPDSLPVMRKLMAFPEGSWVNFTNAYANNSSCCPSRATVLTGQYSHVTGVTHNYNGHNLNDTNTLPVWLDKAGYETVLVGKYLNYYPWDKGDAYIPPGWDKFLVTPRGGVDKYTELSVEFISNSDSPFFLYVAYLAPHYPARPLRRYATAEVYVPPDPPNFNERDVSRKPQWIGALQPLSQSTIDAWHAERIASQRALLGVDDGVQRIVDALKAKRLLDKTMIIFMSDNGFSWGSHRHFNKYCVYEECSKIPLLIRFPGRSENREEFRLVSNVDLASTIAEYAGLFPGLLQNGKSLLPLLSNIATDWKDEVLLERIGTGNAAFYAIRVPGWKYIEYANGDKELYDLTADPYELQNLAGKFEHKRRQAELARRLERLIQNLPE